MKDTTQRDYEIGRCKPPKAYQRAKRLVRPKGLPKSSMKLWTCIHRFMELTDKKLEKLDIKKLNQVQKTALYFVEDIKTGEYPGSERLLHSKLTIKQKGFVEDYLSNEGNATQAALNNYDTQDAAVAQVIGAQNLLKPIIRNEIVRRKAEIERELEGKTGLTVEGIAERFADIAERAKKEGDLVNENRAIENLAKSKIVRFYADDDAIAKNTSLIGILAIVGGKNQPSSKIIDSTPASLASNQLPENMDYQPDNADLADDAGYDDTNESQKDI